jgi:three-Cys-motif partner protein
MSKKLPTIWEAPAHTLAKIEILRSYLQAWFAIMGSSFRGRDLWYIDGFAGPGEYTNSQEGSPIAAMKAANAALTETPRWSAGNIRCVFMEEDPQRFAHLESRLGQLTLDRRLKYEAFPDTFAGGLSQLRTRPDNPFSPPAPLFVFLDPFGAKGLSFPIIADLLSRRSCEVLLHLDSDGITRIYRARAAANYVERLDEVFGDREWLTELAVPSGDEPRAIVTAYKRRLRTLPKVDFAFAFEMSSGRNLVDYHLVFASQHPRGLEKMKEAMKRLDQNGTYRFSSSNVGQHQLFEFHDADAAAQQLLEFFASRTVPYSEIHAYALNESPFTNPKSMLRLLEAQRRITVDARGAKRRIGTYPKSMQPHISVHFHGDHPDG